MKKHDIALTALLAVVLMMMAGLMTENIHSVLNLKSGMVKIDAAKVRAQIAEAGLFLHEAKYWQVLNKSR